MNEPIGLPVSVSNNFTSSCLQRAKIRLSCDVIKRLSLSYSGGKVSFWASSRRSIAGQANRADLLPLKRNLQFRPQVFVFRRRFDATRFFAGRDIVEDNCLVIEMAPRLRLSAVNWRHIFSRPRPSIGIDQANLPVSI